MNTYITTHNEKFSGKLVLLHTYQTDQILKNSKLSSFFIILHVYNAWPWEQKTLTSTVEFNCICTCVVTCVVVWVSCSWLGGL